jgi:glycosyl-4,4'-diaponeurosporenoate acyltransferase
VSIRVIELSLGWTVAVDVVAWAAIGTATGYATHRAPLRRFERDGPFTRLRAFERDGRWYERTLAIKSWKARLPEAGGLFEGGFSKRELRTGADREAVLRRFVIETRRAEVTHWVVMAAGPFFFLWNPWGLALVMVAYGVIANLPCLLIQRYNRARLLRVLARANHRAGPRS